MFQPKAMTKNQQIGPSFDDFLAEQLEWLRAKLAKSIESGVSQTNPDDLLLLFKDRMKHQ